MDKCNSKPITHTPPTTLTPPRTPTALETSAHCLLSEIQQIHTTLSTLPSLAPGPQTDTLLTRLVALCIQSRTPAFTSYFFSIPHVSPLCTSLRALCAAAEGALESHWARAIIATARLDPKTSRTDLLDAFPYYQNYIALSRLECSTLEAFLAAPPTNITFIGSGPLPLSSLCMLDRYPRATVWNVDRDAAALGVSRELCGALGYAGMEFACADVTVESAGNEEWMASGVVFLAALVGEDTGSKMGILEALARKLGPGTLVVARSARGLRSVLYPVSRSCALL